MAQLRFEFGGIQHQAAGADIAGQAFERMGRPYRRVAVVDRQRRPYPFQAVGLGFTEALEQLAQQGAITVQALQRRIHLQAGNHRQVGILRCQFWQRPTGARGLDPALQGDEQLIDVEGFGNVIVHPGLQAFFLVAGHGIGSHGQNRQLGKVCLRANSPGRLKAVHHWHLTVHQYPVVGGFGHHGQGFGTVTGDIYANPGAGENLYGHFLIDLIVFHQQQVSALQGLAGIVHLGQQLFLARTGQGLLAEGVENAVEQG